MVCWATDNCREYTWGVLDDREKNIEVVWIYVARCGVLNATKNIEVILIYVANMYTKIQITTHIITVLMHWRLTIYTANHFWEISDVMEDSLNPLNCPNNCNDLTHRYSMNIINYVIIVLWGVYICLCSYQRRKSTMWPSINYTYLPFLRVIKVKQETAMFLIKPNYLRWWRKLLILGYLERKQKVL